MVEGLTYSVGEKGHEDSNTDIGGGGGDECVLLLENISY
jgi:hypothetical protein